MSLRKFISNERLHKNCSFRHENSNPKRLKITLDNPLVEHSFCDFAKRGDVCAIDIIDKAILMAEPDTLVMDGLHDGAQPLVDFVIRPLQPHAVLRHLQPTD